VFFFRLIGLIVFPVAIMGTQGGDAQGGATFIVFSLLAALYMLPTIEAFLKGHKDLVSIGLLNLFLGWSLLGWIGALVWAFKKPLDDSSVSIAKSQSKDKMKACPFCAEKVLFAAIKCKHCGSDFVNK
jgi:hypothetical protein